MIILHATWVPHTFTENYLTSKVAIWGENGSRFTQLHPLQNNSVVQKRENSFDRGREYISHSFSIDSEKLISLIALIEGDQHSTHDITMHKLNHPIITYADENEIYSAPLLFEYLNYGLKKPKLKELSILHSQVERKLLSYFKTLPQVFQLPQIPVEVPSCVLSISEFLQFIKGLQKLISQNPSSDSSCLEVDNSKILFSQDIIFFLSISRWIEDILCKNIRPRILKHKDWLKSFPTVWKRSTENDDVANYYMGWWYVNQDNIDQNKLIQYSSYLPPSLSFPYLNQNRTNNTNVERKNLNELNTQPYDFNSISQLNFSIFYDIISWIINTRIRIEPIARRTYTLSNVKLDVMPKSYFKQVHRSLFSPNPIFVATSNEEIEWFVNQFNSWFVVKDSSDNHHSWKLSLVLVPPEKEILDDWYLSFVLTNIANPSILLTSDQIFFPSKYDQLPQFLNSLNPLKIIKQKISGILDDIPYLKNYISLRDIQSYISISSDKIPEFINTISSSIENSLYGLLLPKNFQHKFIAPSNISISINISTNKSLSLEKYNISLLIADQKIPIDEILELAKSKAGLVQINDKWISFDPKEAEKMEKLIQKQLLSPNTLDLLKIELLGFKTINDKSFNSFSNNYSITSDVFSKIKNGVQKDIKLKTLNATLRPYQREGVDWLRSHINWQLGGILADDMGLGKTIQTLAALLSLKEQKKLKNILIICPTSVIGNWRNELQAFAPNLNFHLHYGMKRIQTKSEFKKLLKSSEIILTTYSITRRDSELFIAQKWQGIIVDEAQAIKNHKTKLHRTLTSINSSFRFGLTGTPIENNLIDLWSLFNFALPGYLGNLTQFKTTFVKPIQEDDDDNQIQSLHKLISPFILRRYKTDPKIIKDLPDKMEEKIICGMSKEQIALYHAISTKSLEKLKQSEDIKRRGIILATMTRLKQVCNHPANYLRDGDNSEKRSGKFRVLYDLLETIFENNEKVLIFSQYRVMCSLLLDFVKEKFDVPSLQIHGGTSAEDRQKYINNFSEIIGPSVFVISLRAGGTGLNLFAANHVIHFDRWWNPAVENQASDRVYRIGQQKDVIIYKLVCQGSIEEQIDNLIENKQKLSDQVIGGIQQDFTNLTFNEFKELIELRAVLDI